MSPGFPLLSESDRSGLEIPTGACRKSPDGRLSSLVGRGDAADAADASKKRRSSRPKIVNWRVPCWHSSRSLRPSASSRCQLQLTFFPQRLASSLIASHGTAFPP